jgi:hypothetical protein
MVTEGKKSGGSHSEPETRKVKKETKKESE